MTHAYHQIAFTDAVKSAQETQGSRAAYTAPEDGAVTNDVFGPDEAAFIESRDSFYMATVSETGWPYIQHRGGPAGFLKVVDQKTLGFADMRGNRQYVSVGNLAGDARVSLFLMDYARKARMKLFGRARVIDTDAAARADLVPEGFERRVERGVLIDIEAFDWNCPQYITERFTKAEVQGALAQMGARIAELEADLAQLEGR